LDLARQYGIENVLSLVVSDDQALQAVERFADEYRMLVEPACGASLVPLFEPELLRNLCPNLNSSSTVVIEVCGGFQVNREMISSWRQQII
jgi:L-serine/L-threonine ammonia-lyase